MITKNVPQLTLPRASAKGTTSHLNLDNKTQNCRGIIVSREGTKDFKIRKDFDCKKMVPRLTLPSKTIDYRFARGQGLTLLRDKAARKHMV